MVDDLAESEKNASKTQWSAASYGGTADAMNPELIPNVESDARRLLNANNTMRSAMDSVLSLDELNVLRNAVNNAAKVKAAAGPGKMTNATAFHHAWSEIRDTNHSAGTTYGVFMHIIATIFCNAPLPDEARPAPEQEVWMKRYKLVRDAYLQVRPEIYPPSAADCGPTSLGDLVGKIDRDLAPLVGGLNRSDQAIAVLQKTYRNDQDAASHMMMETGNGSRDPNQPAWGSTRIPGGALESPFGRGPSPNRMDVPSSSRDPSRDAVKETFPF